MIPLRNFVSDTIDSVMPDSLSRLYNNLWGAYSNTNMRRLPDRTYEITGHAIRYTGYFVNLLTCKTAPQSQLINLDKSWNEILVQNNLCAWFDKDTSGFPVIRIKSCCDACQPGLEIPASEDTGCITCTDNRSLPYMYKVPED